MSAKPGFKIIGIVIIVAQSLLLLTSVGFSVLLLENGRQLKEYEADYVTLNDIKYGLLNENIWKQQISAILTGEIADALSPARLGPTLHAAIKSTIEQEVETSIPDFDLYFYSKSELINDLRSGGITDAIVKRVSGLASTIATEMDVQSLVLNGIERAFGKIRMQEVEVQVVLEKYSQSVIGNCNRILEERIDEKKKSEKTQMSFIAAIMVLMVLISFFSSRKLPGFSFALMTGVAFNALVLGLLLPFLNMDARIEHIEVNLFSELITFDNQIILFQSKSILEIVKSLLTQTDFMVVGVGILVLLFSLVTPVFKLISSVLIKTGVIHSPGYSAFIKNLGKWSMADVFTVALFMAFLGMNGLVSSHLQQLNQTGETLINTANYTQLKPGLLFFTLYTLISILSTGKRFGSETGTG